MPDGLNLIAENLAVGNIAAIDFRVGRKTQSPVEFIVETVCRVPHFYLSGLIPTATLFLESHVVIEIEMRSHIDNIEQRERGFDGNLMLKAVRPVPNQIRMEQLAFLGLY